jgi:cyclopropane fatty-acyl-phospholipid synthase-like methyltransferase
MKSLSVFIATIVAGVLDGGCAPPPKEPRGPDANVVHGHTHAEGAHGHDASGGHFAHRFDDAASWAKVFDDPARDEWQKPEFVLDALRLKASDRVADIGSGTGYFAVRVARRVPKGIVYGADVEPDMVRYLAERATREGIPNIRSVQSTVNEPRLPESVDVVLVVDTYHHIPRRVAYFKALLGQLRPGGRLVVIDFTKESPLGPPPAHRISVERLTDELAQAGYGLRKCHDGLPNQYFCEFERTTTTRSP